MREEAYGEEKDEPKITIDDNNYLISNLSEAPSYSLQIFNSDTKYNSSIMNCVQIQLE